jgi:putative transcriptional regulator
MLELFRNKGKITRLLLLLEIVTDRPGDQRSLAEPVGITPQAVSDYISRMREEGLVAVGPEGPRATVKGVELLHRDLLSMKDFVDTSIGKLDIIRSTDAVAIDALKRGDRVYLIMEDGLLCAVKEGSGSEGVAERDANPGEMVPISSLTGMVDLKPGVLKLVEIPPARAGGGRGHLTLDFLLDTCGQGSGNYRIAALDLESLALFRRSGMSLDMEMPPPEGVIEPMVRGLDVIAVGTPYSISRVLRAMERSPSGSGVERYPLSAEVFQQEKP